MSGDRQPYAAVALVISVCSTPSPPTLTWCRHERVPGTRYASARTAPPYSLGAGPSTLYFLSAVRSDAGSTSTTTLERPTTSPSESKL